MNTTTNEVTDAQISKLRTEAAQAGDHAQALICDLALGEVEIDEDTTSESLRIWSFLSPSDQRRIRGMSVEDCRAACERAILSARAQVDA